MDPTFRKVVGKLSEGDRRRFDELDAELERLAHLKPAEIDRGLGMADVSREAPPTHVLGTGLYTHPGEEVQPGFLSILDSGAAAVEPPQGLDSTGRRTALARWLADPSNPLTARVMANRIWHYHFGRGIVATPSDFGLMGAQPTHPQLLDWLAAEFVAGGWSVKHLHRLIMASSTYRQSAQAAEVRGTAPGRRADPFNRLLWRFPSQRLVGESVRDSALAVAGLLDRTVGGPSVFPPAASRSAEARRRLGHGQGVRRGPPAERLHLRQAQ